MVRVLSAGCLSGTFLLLLSAAGMIEAKTTVDAKMSKDVDLSQFYTLIENNPIANSTLMYRGVTVFAPTNLAFQYYYKSKTPSQSDSNLVLYHMSNVPLRRQQFGQSLTSEFEGNPPLWVTRKRGRDNREEIYINNALILDNSDYVSELPNDKSKLQVLHKISEVLEPVSRIQSHMEPIYNPNAMEFLNHSEKINLGTHRIRTYRRQVEMHKKENVFTAEGKYTFFIPVDEGFKPVPRANMVDGKVIDGHIIPNHVLFTAPTPSNRAYETLAFGDNLKVTLSFSTEHFDKGTKVYVKSDTILGDAQHPAASVIAEVVKANIPVRNGVVHLIQNPLMIVDTTLYEFIQSWKDREDGPLSKFYEVIRDQAKNEFIRSASRFSNVTLFAPRNAAWDHEEVRQILQDKQRINEILDLHLVKDYLPLHVIKQKLSRQASTLATKKSLYFNMAGNETVTVEGGGVNATIITANIGVTNGVIHIIDKVLGIPFTTVQDKLKTDPSLNTTNFLGNRSGFNERLSDTSKRFTFFAPIDRAWETGAINNPTPFKTIFLPDYTYQTKHLLERHLVISDQPLTMKRIYDMARNKTVKLASVRDQLTFKIKDAESYTFEWNGKWVKVVRPDVACTNGIIHVIDTVLLRERDVHVTANAASATIVMVLPHILAFLIAKLLI